MRLKIDATKARAGTIKELAALIRDFPGESPVYADLMTSSGRKTYAFGPQYKVQPAPDFYAEVKMILGESAVATVFRSTRSPQRREAEGYARIGCLLGLMSQISFGWRCSLRSHGGCRRATTGPGSSSCPS